MKKYAEQVRGEIHARWVQYAAQHGAVLTGAFPFIGLRGVENGLPYRFYQTETQEETADSEGTHPITVHRAEVSYKDAERLGTLCVFPENFMMKIAKFLGYTDYVMGDAEFDPLFMVRDRDEAHARRLLTPAVLAAFVQAHRQGLQISIGDHEILGRAHFPVEDPAQLHPLIHQVTWIASQLGK